MPPPGARAQREVAAGNAPAIAFYERLGYRKVAHLAGYYGAGQHAWTMAKALDAAEIGGARCGS